MHVAILNLKEMKIKLFLILGGYMYFQRRPKKERKYKSKFDLIKRKMYHNKLKRNL